MMRLVLVTLALALALHIGIVVAVPYGVMSIFLSRFTAQAGVNRIARPPLPDDTARGVVAPSPDLLYGVCAYDLGGGPLRITMRPPAGYWSVALYDRNTDNFYHRNDSDTNGRDFDLILTADAPSLALSARFPTAQFVTTPHQTGLMLARLLVLDRDKADTALAAQASLRCDPVEPTK
jgi:uncharacterized membrane protein